ncbi:hypothetical protein ETI03_00105 [Macrococcoides canis]|uniref:NAD(P)/FAD-dependent oxidoreductase n=1 Tax=Macrococcoides canis TaxID=1855823 RepID=UPI00105E865F|nr:NAD(P)/FAD-dependent oxidoreductase [Macrococcus canis]TDM32132.1 hypothetical protein ETI03_00105 [Macrococcus canis]
MIAIIGGGPTGIGLGYALEQLGYQDYMIYEKDEVGATFFNWPKETKLITPSFNGHGFGLLDLNAIMPDSSPAYTLNQEHLSGELYGEYLAQIEEQFELNVTVGCEVQEIIPANKGITLKTNIGDIEADAVILACGEFNAPKRLFDYGIPYSDVTTWQDIEGERIIIGSGESAMDALINLNRQGERVLLIHPDEKLLLDHHDPSQTISPYTKERLLTLNSNLIRVMNNRRAESIDMDNERFKVVLDNGETIMSKNEPIVCTGFHTVPPVFQHLFEMKDGLAQLTAVDQSTKHNNIYLCGPGVRQSDVIFCFIYKFRQRFLVVLEDILIREGFEIDESVKQDYIRQNMYLTDLTCCNAECQC